MSDIEKVKQLREATGAGFKDCNLAVKESDGDLDKAIEILRVKGISKASKKMSRDAKEGVIATFGNENSTGPGFGKSKLFWMGAEPNSKKAVCTTYDISGVVAELSYP